jgi:sulfhydrogenase subunit alpha
MGSITLNHITKVEGHARLDLEVVDGALKKCELGSIEGSRYFEGLLKGRGYDEAQEISTRICGICSSAHNVAAIMAIENALDIKPSRQTITLRQLQTIGERIRSHATHLYFLALPDYLGYESALAMPPHYKELISRALRLIKLGNDMVVLTTGRVIHPVAPTIGGFLHVPPKKDLEDIRDRLDKADEDIMETNNMIASLEFPDFERDKQYLSIFKEDEFGTSQGTIKIGDHIFDQHEFHTFVQEYHEPFSTANFVVKEGKSYAVGALARINNSKHLLSPKTQEYMQGLAIQFPSRNPHHSIVAQALELIHYREVCLDLLDNFAVVQEEIAPVQLREGHGIAATEAPRGTLWHEYTVDKHGVITYANIVTPTAQFLRALNEDIAAYVRQLLDADTSQQEIIAAIEKLIRSYDPCFSCSSHFLTVNWH